MLPNLRRFYKTYVISIKGQFIFNIRDISLANGSLMTFLMSQFSPKMSVGLAI